MSRQCNFRRFCSRFQAALGLLLLTVAPAVMAQSQKGLEPGVPNFFKVFAPDTIGPGSTTRLTFTIDQPSMPVSDLAFTDNLPAGMTIASVPGVLTDCVNAAITAPAGGTTISFSGATLGANQTCTVAVNITGTLTGTNISNSLTSSAGSSGSAADTLTVDTARPGFSKSFSPAMIPGGGTSTLTFLIDNSANSSDEIFLGFSDPLPGGLVVAPVPNAVTDCGAQAGGRLLTADAGSNSISFSYFGSAMFPAVGAGASCTVSVDVRAEGNGTFNNVSGNLEATNSLISGFATAPLAAPVTFLSKLFTDDPVPPGGVVNLRFSLQNPDRASAATDITFSDDLEAVIAGLAPSGPLPADPCGAGSSVGFDMGLLSLTGGSLAPEGACSFDVALLVPAGAAAGGFANTTSAITANIGGEAVVGNTASDLLTVSTAPQLIKTFTDDPVGAGGSVTLEFTLINTDPTQGLTDIAFEDDLNMAILGLAANSLVASNGTDPEPLVDPCGSGSELTIFDLNDQFPTFPPVPPDPTMLIFTGGSLAAAGMPGDACTFSVVVDVPAGVASGIYVNTTTEGTVTQGASTVPLLPANGDLQVVGAPRLTKEFTDDPVAPGGTVTLAFTIEHEEAAPGDATGIAFTDDLTTLTPAVSGLTATSVVSNDCGAIVDIGTSNTLIDVSGGSLMPGATCTIAVSLSVPGAVTPGRKTSTSSAITATVAGLATTGNPASDDLRIAGLMLSKEFTDDPVIPGDTVNLRFTLDNTSGVADATAIQFSDNLNAALSGLTVAMAGADNCNGTPAGAGTGTFSYSGGSVLAGASCTIDVALNVPAAAANGDYLNVTSNLTATIGGTPGFVLDPATDVLSVDDELLAIAKSFTDDPALPGGSVTLELTVSNLDQNRAASSVAFSDDLGAALAGLTIDSVLLDTCGGTLAGVGTLTYSGGSLAAGGNCTLRLSLDIPPAPLPGNIFTNTTSTVTGTINGFPVSGPPASDDLRVLTLTLAKAFGGIGFPDRTVDLTFTLTNLDTNAGVSPLSFSDAFPAGIVATGLPASNVCGAGSTVSGTSLLTLNGASLAPGGSCQFTVAVLLPVSAAPGTVVNTTSELFSQGLVVGGSATATLTVEAPPTFSKAFSPTSLDAGQPSTLTFTINNPASTVAATGLAFTDNLPAGMVVASPALAGATCTGGTLTAVPGSSVISYTGGNVGAGSSCTLSANVTGTSAASYTNTSGDLTSSSGNSGPASATLTVTPARLDLSISITNNEIEVYDLDMYDYLVTVNNLLTAQAVGAQVSVPMPSAVGSATWSCVPSGGASCSASGTDDIDDTVTMPSGSSLVYTWTAVLARTVETQLDVTATVTAPTGLTDLDLNNNTATDSDPILEQIVFRSSFEDGEGMVVKRSAGQSLLPEATFKLAGPHPTPALRVEDARGRAVILVHQRRVHGELQLRIALNEGDGWAIGDWQAVAEAGDLWVTWAR